MTLESIWRWRLPLLVVLALLVTLVGAAPWAAAQPDDPPPDDESAAEALPDDPAWLALQDWVSQLRGLPLLRPVPRVLLGPDAFRARQAEVYRAYLDPADMERTRQLLLGLGLLDADDDLAALLVDLYSALPIGFYDPLDGVIYARASADPNGPLERVILAHEFVHALQDQHYGILRLYGQGVGNADRDQALATLLEGDALLVQEMYVATTQPETVEERVIQQQVYEQALQQVYVEIRQTLRIDFDLVPAAVVQQVYSPYLDGPAFIHEVAGTAALTTFGAYGPAVRRLFERPPGSTAEILHPERYRRGWQPAPVALPDLGAALGDDWQLLRRQVVGELDHRSLLARDLPPAEAEDAAAGWAGNRAAVFVNDAGEAATVSATHWQSAAAADAWAGAFAAAVAVRHADDATLVWAEQGRQVWQAADQAILLEVRADQTRMVQAPTVATAEALADATVPVGAGPAAFDAARASMTPWARFAAPVR